MKPLGAPPGKLTKPPLPARIMVPSCLGSSLFCGLSAACFTALLISGLSAGLEVMYSEPNYPGNGPAVYDPPHPLLRPGVIGFFILSLVILFGGLIAAHKARGRG